nr:MULTISPECIES: class I SAM-dependent methyltransferase [Myxococcaceae]
MRSTLPFLSEQLTAREVDYLARALGPRAPAGWVVDLGCGHGRHAAPLNREGPLAGRVMGLERDERSLAQRLPGFPVVRGDLRTLPFGARALAGAYAWYTSLFTYSDEEHREMLRELARVLRPGAPLVLQTVPWERMAAAPEAAFRQALPDGSVLEETSRFDPRTGRDHGERRLSIPDGRVLCGAYAIRYYPLADLTQLLESAGFSVAWVHGGLAGEPLSSTSTDLILGAERTHG